MYTVVNVWGLGYDLVTPHSIPIRLQWERLVINNNKSLPSFMGNDQRPKVDAGVEQQQIIKWNRERWAWCHQRGSICPSEPSHNCHSLILGIYFTLTSGLFSGSKNKPNIFLSAWYFSFTWLLLILWELLQNTATENYILLVFGLSKTTTVKHG